MQQIQERVSRRLFGRDDPQVTEIGLDLDGDDVAVVVTLFPHTEASAQQARSWLRRTQSWSYRARAFR
ncbi:MAG TPA: hypothetical protein VE441_03120 [Mycobacterium sp.]|jgi:hypothetical protein|nr:hypothetical protein [Mycobacterium sp.]